MGGESTAGRPLCKRSPANSSNALVKVKDVQRRWSVDLRAITSEAFRRKMQGRAARSVAQSACIESRAPRLGRDRAAAPPDRGSSRCRSRRAGARVEQRRARARRAGDAAHADDRNRDARGDARRPGRARRRGSPGPTGRRCRRPARAPSLRRERPARSVLIRETASAPPPARRPRRRRATSAVFGVSLTISGLLSSGRTCSISGASRTSRVGADVEARRDVRAGHVELDAAATPSACSSAPTQLAELPRASRPSRCDERYRLGTRQRTVKLPAVPRPCSGRAPRLGRPIELIMPAGRLPQPRRRVAVARRRRDRLGDVGREREVLGSASPKIRVAASASKRARGVDDAGARARGRRTRRSRRGPGELVDALEQRTVEDRPVDAGAQVAAAAAGDDAAVAGAEAAGHRRLQRELAAGTRRASQRGAHAPRASPRARRRRRSPARGRAPRRGGR